MTYTYDETRLDECPVGQGQFLECEFTGLVSGGTVSLLWRMENATTWNNGPTVTVRGLPGPTEAQFRNHILANLPNSPWFLKWIPGAEGNATDRWNQFKSDGNPKWGFPSGYGVMQIDPPTGRGAGRPAIAVMYNWRVNVDAAHDSLWIEKKPAVDAFWRQQVDDWIEFNGQNPNNPAPPPPDIVEGNCAFRFSAAGPDESQGVFQTEDANWIKSYNSGFYISFANGNWILNPTNGMGFNYVNRLCTHFQP